MAFASLVLITLKTYGVEGKVGILRSIIQPEQPHHATVVLSAISLYHAVSRAVTPMVTTPRKVPDCSLVAPCRRWLKPKSGSGLMASFRRLLHPILEDIFNFQLE
jgi:hypothetical protein